MHPVIAAFIKKKWDKVLKYYVIHIITYALLLIVFTVYIFKLFTNPDKYFYSFNYPTNNSNTSEYYSPKHTENILPFVIPMTCLSMMLGYFEICQIWSEGKSYFKEIENYIEWLVIIFSTFSVYCYRLIKQESRNAAFVRGISAMGISLAWLEFIFLLGRDFWTIR